MLPKGWTDEAVFEMAQRVARSLCFRHDEREDASSVALVKGLIVVRRFPEMKPSGLWRSMKNAWLDDVAHRKACLQPLSYDHDSIVNKFELGDMGPLDIIGPCAGGFEGVDVRLAIEVAAERLGGDASEIIRLIVEGHTAKESSEILGVSVLAAKSRIHRTRERLKAVLA